MTITVLGAGYVGLTTAALLAHSGYTVYAVEPNQERLGAIQSGRSFFFEDGLDPVIAEALKKGTLIPTDSYTQSVPKSQVVFSCVGTPDNPDGSSNLDYVFSAAEQSANLMKNGTVFVQKSTVPVGTGQEIEALFAKKGKEIGYVSNPEFLREGTALYDTLYFDRIVVGGRSNAAKEQILAIYRQLEDHRDQIAKLANISRGQTNGTYISTALNSAELIKVTANAFLSLKISFANSIAKLSDRVNADIVEVMDAVGADARIGRSFLNAGRGYGGGCFPKDVSGLIASGLRHGIELEIMTASQAVNDSMAGYVVEKTKDALGGLEDKKVAVLGLAFKKGTSDVRRSPGVLIANTLSRANAHVSAFDPQANGEAEEDLRRDVTITHTLEETIQDADAVIIATDWPEFINLAPENFRSAMRGIVFVDAYNAFSIPAVEACGLKYIGVGRGPTPHDILK